MAKSDPTANSLQVPLQWVAFISGIIQFPFFFLNILLLAKRSWSSWAEQGFPTDTVLVLAAQRPLSNGPPRELRVFPIPMRPSSKLAVPCHTCCVSANNVLSYKLITKWLMSIFLSSQMVEGLRTCGEERRRVEDGGKELPPSMEREMPQYPGTPCISPPSATLWASAGRFFWIMGHFLVLIRCNFASSFYDLASPLKLAFVLLWHAKGAPQSINIGNYL